MIKEYQYKVEFIFEHKDIMIIIIKSTTLSMSYHHFKKVGIVNYTFGNRA